jgi:hypothetical protein
VAADPWRQSDAAAGTEARRLTVVSSVTGESSADQVVIRNRFACSRVDGFAGGIPQVVGQIDKGPSGGELLADERDVGISRVPPGPTR